MDSIINFGEPLKPAIIGKAWEQGDRSDVMIAMGCSMRVNPAAAIAQQLAQFGGLLIICNLQKTPMDDFAHMVIHAKCDDIMELLFQKLKMKIPEFILSRWIKCSLESKQGKETISVEGIDNCGGPYDLFKSIKINGSIGDSKTLTPKEIQNDGIEISLKFQGHWNENDLSFKVSREELIANNGVLSMEILGNPFGSAVWKW